MTDNGKANGGAILAPAAGIELWGPALAGAAKWNGKMCEGFALLGTEWLDFVNRRLKEDLNLPQRMCACRSAEELRDIYTAFWRQAIDDYQKEFTVMTKLGSSFLSNSLTAMQTRVEEAAHELRRPFAAAA
ncbi:MAG: phasin family protein [Hyphomicrobiaceae bacterium]|nr:phasin family protein [Hyphomicrobiaceae bacterium]